MDLDSYLRWKSKNEKLRAQALEIVLRYPRCAHPWPPFPYLPAENEEKIMAVLWLRDYKELVKHWFGNRNKRYVLDYDSDLGENIEVDLKNEMNADLFKPQGVSAIMVAFAKRFKLSVGLEEDDKLDTLEDLLLGLTSSKTQRR